MAEWEPLRKHCWSIEGLPDDLTLSLAWIKSEPGRCVIGFRSWVDKPSAMFALLKDFARKPLIIVQYGPWMSDDPDGAVVRRTKVAFDEMKPMPFDLDYGADPQAPDKGQTFECVLLTRPEYTLLPNARSAT